MKWSWTLLFALVLTILVVEVTGYFLPSRTEVERRVDVGAAPDEVHALISDLATWPDWSPLLRGPDGERFEPEFLGPTSGPEAQMQVRYGDRQKVLFTTVEYDAPRLLTLNTRSGLPEADLLAGEGFEAWDRFELESLDAGRTRLVWRRTGSEIESYWMRFLDRFVVRKRVETALDRACAAIADRFAD